MEMVGTVFVTYLLAHNGLQEILERSICATINVTFCAIRDVCLKFSKTIVSV